MPARSRILFAESGTEKMMSIDRTLKKYGELTASELVNLTHSQNSPWTETPKGMLSQIELETIKDYHQFEQI